MLKKWNSEPVLKSLSTFLNSDEKLVLRAKTMDEAKNIIIKTAKETKTLNNCYEELEMLNEKNANDILLSMQQKILKTKSSL